MNGRLPGWQRSVLHEFTEAKGAGAPKPMLSPPNAPLGLVEIGPQRPFAMTQKRQRAIAGDALFERLHKI
jgi:hypothetical protein